MNAYSIALGGVRVARAMMSDAASNVSSGDIDRYAESFVLMVRARNAQAANLKTIETQRAMDRSLLDIIV